MIALRGHHLLCALTFTKIGYTRGFEERFHALLGRISGGEPIRIVAGPDDLCAEIVDREGAHCREARIFERDRLALADLSRLLDRPLGEGERIDAGQLLAPGYRDAFARGTVRRACRGCQWKALCDEVATGGFARSVLTEGSKG